jgi:phosphatidylserine decarboxylase
LSILHRSFLQNSLPQHALTIFAGWLANCKIQWIKNRLIQYFVWKYPVNLLEAAEPNPYAYPSFNAFFTRALQKDARPIVIEAQTLTSPADGEISQLGKIQEDSILQAKGRFFSAAALLGNDADLAKPFLNGSFLTVYLAPKDYHRVHMPFDGTLTDMIYIPGSLFSVSTKTAESIHHLFARNERVVAFFNTVVGRMAVVLVGAMIVGSIETVWAGSITSPRGQTIRHWHYEENTIQLKQGDELGRFKLGSTAIVLVENNLAEWDPILQALSPVKMGQAIGFIR